MTALAVRLPNWVGDACMALPALRLLLDRGLSVEAFGRAWAADLLAGLPVAVRELPRGLGSGAAALRASGASRGLLFTNSFGTALQMRMAGIPATGYRGDGRRFLLGRALRRPSGCHEVEAFWRLAVAALAGIGEPAPDAPIPALRLKLADRHHAGAEAALRQRALGPRFTVLCPLATGTSGGRDKAWPLFASLCQGLIDRGETVVACPGPGESERCAAALPGAVLLDGLGLGAYAAVLSRASRVVANDSGPLHLAAAVDAPVLGIFGVSDPSRTRPWSKRGAVIGDGRTWPDLDAVRDALDRMPPPDASP